MITDDFLLEQGFKRYEPSWVHSKYVECFFQKRYDDEVGKKYFIDLEKYPEIEFHDGTHYGPSYEVTACFEKGNKAISIKLYSDWELAEAEKMVETLWEAGEFDYYETFDEN